jgi:predicted MFS family arabinose efflux permease
MLAVALLFMGQFALFTFLRPFLERVTQVIVSTLSLLLLIMGVAGLIGTYLIGFFVKGRLKATLIGTPAIMAVIALMLIVWGHSSLLTAALLAGWGLIGTAAPVAWWTWLSRTLPDNAEAGGGLMVAVIQMAITLGASIGGYLFDHSGYQSTFVASAVLLSAASIVGAFSYRETR